MLEQARDLDFRLSSSYERNSLAHHDEHELSTRLLEDVRASSSTAKIAVERTSAWTTAAIDQCYKKEGCRDFMKTMH
jgi:hypothetical protein